MKGDVVIHIDILTGTAVAVVDEQPELVLAAGPGGFQGTMPKVAGTVAAAETPKAEKQAGQIPADVLALMKKKLMSHPEPDADHPYALYVQGELFGHSRNKISDRVKSLLGGKVPAGLIKIVDTRDGSVYLGTDFARG